MPNEAPPATSVSNLIEHPLPGAKAAVESKAAKSDRGRWCFSLREYMGLVTIVILSIGLAFSIQRLRYLQIEVTKLREETGYAGDAPEPVGFVYANPAIMNNKVHTVMIRNAQLKHDTNLDDGEDVAARLVPLADIPGLIADGTISHSLMVAAFFRFQIAENAD